MAASAKGCDQVTSCAIAACPWATSCSSRSEGTSAVNRLAAGSPARAAAAITPASRIAAISRHPSGPLPSRDTSTIASSRRGSLLADREGTSRVTEREGDGGGVVAAPACFAGSSACVWGMSWRVMPCRGSARISSSVPTLVSSDSSSEGVRIARAAVSDPANPESIIAAIHTAGDFSRRSAAVTPAHAWFIATSPAPIPGARTRAEAQAFWAVRHAVSAFHTPTASRSRSTPGDVFTCRIHWLVRASRVDCAIASHAAP